MKIDSIYDPTLCTGDPKEVHRPYDMVSVQEFEGRMCAVTTDGRSLCATPVEMGPHDKPGLYPAKAFAPRNYDAETGERLPCRELDLLGDRTARDELAGTTYTQREPEHGFPEVEGVIPDGMPKLRIRLDPERLLRLAKALGACESDVPCVTIEVFGKADALAVSTDDATGYMMPIRTGEDLHAESMEKTGGAR